jgi:hypothetical protein
MIEFDAAAVPVAVTITGAISAITVAVVAGITAVDDRHCRRVGSLL